MSEWHTKRTRSRRARLLVALTLAAPFLVVAPFEASGRGNPIVTVPGPAPTSAATPEAGPPLIMYDVRRALEQVERQV